MATLHIGDGALRMRFTRGEKVLGVLRDVDQSAVRLRLRGHRYDEMLPGRDDAESLVDALRAHVPGEPPT